MENVVLCMLIKRGTRLFDKDNFKLYKNLSKKMVKILPSKPTVEEVLKDLEVNHNHSWYQEVYEKNVNNLDDIALLYRGRKILYKELFDNIEKYAKSLKQMGMGEDSEIPVCISNCPEVVYLMGAASMIGAKLNLFGAKYPSDYITEIINGCNTNLIFVEDNYYEKIKEGIDASKIKTIVMTSLTDSLKNGINPYEKMETQPELFINKVNKYKSMNDKIISQNEFVQIGQQYNGELNANVDINKDFVITYTSGSTNEKRPKAIVHSSKSFITVGRFHNKDMNGGFSLKKFTFLAHIPTFSNTNLVSCISDALIQGAQLALEPCYSKEQFLNTLLIYKPHYVAATKSFWINISKKILYDKKYENAKLSNLFLAFSCGEPFEINEENFINSAMKKAKMGVNVTHTPVSILKMSEAAGDCEHGSIFYTLFRKYGSYKPKVKMTGEAEGLKYFPFAEVAVLDENGNVLEKNKLGRIVANSPCTMKEYKNNKEATEKFYVVDSTGKKWADMSVYGYINEDNRVFIRGRIPKNGEILPTFVVAKKILKDTANILSCEVVKDDETDSLVAHIELMPTCNKNIDLILHDASERCKEILLDNNLKLYFKIWSFDNSFPLTASGKRDVKKLKNMGLQDDYIDSSVYLNNNIKEKQFF